MGEIVVGLHVSPASHAALAWAAYQARTTGAELRAVHAIHAVLLPAPMLASVGWLNVPFCLSHAVCPVVAVPQAANRAFESEPGQRADGGFAGT